MQAQQERAPETSSMQSTVTDRRTYRRIRLPLDARFLLNDEREFPAKLRTISAGEAVIDCEAPVKRGDKVILYIDHIGRMEGIVKATASKAIRVYFDVRRSRRARMADTLIRLVNRGTHDFERRRAIRIRQNRAAKAELEDGSTVDCRILDISVTGASVAINPRPDIGRVMIIGKMRGRVVRHHESGIGLEFIKD